MPGSDGTSDRKARRLVCPTCGKGLFRDETDTPPFCSERCKLIDLGKWMDGEYAIPGEPAAVPDDQRPPDADDD